MVIGSHRWHICDTKIYECHLRDASGAVDHTQQWIHPYVGTCNRDKKTRGTGSTDTALLLVCRQFYGEAAKLKWQNHIFQFTSFHDNRLMWLNLLSDWQLKATRTLHVHYDGRIQLNWLMWRISSHLISQMDGLRHLILVPSMGSRSREVMWEIIRRHLLAFRPLKMELTRVFILAHTFPEVPDGTPSFTDFSEVWRDPRADPTISDEDRELLRLREDLPLMRMFHRWIPTLLKFGIDVEKTTATC